MKKQGHHTIDTILNKSVLDHSLNPLQRFKDPRLASSCTGYLASNVIEEKMLINMKTNPSSSFYADQKTFEIKDAAGNTIIEKKLISARSRNCCFSSPYEDEVGKEYPFPSFICISCQGISKSRSFENEMNKRDALGDPIIKPTTNIKFLDREALENKSRDQAALIKYLRLHLHECKRRALEAALRRNEDPIYSFLKDANNGNIDKLVVNIINAAKAGKLEENSFKYQFLENMTKNLAVPPSQRRFNKCIKNFVASLRITSGQKAVNILNNVLDISSKTVNKHIKDEGLHLSPGFSIETLTHNFKLVGSVYEKKIKALQDKGEKDIEKGFNSSIGIDETGILKGVNPIRNSDGSLSLIGFCGCKIDGDGGASKDLLGLDIKVETLDDVLNAFATFKKCTSTSVVIICPNDPRLPCFVCGVGPTCMCFKKEDMKRVMTDIMKVANQTFGVVFKHPVSGWATDGCLARVPIEWEEMAIYSKQWILRRDKDTIFTVWNSCLGLGGITDSDGIAGGINGQDQLHCLKKFWQSIESISRFITINGLIIHASVVFKALRNKASVFDFGNNRFHSTKDSLRVLVSDGTGTTKSDVYNKDPMNVRAVQQKISFQTQEKLITDNETTNKATIWYLQMMWYYRMIFFAVLIPLDDRIEFCGFVITCLFLLYEQIETDTKMNHKDNFITANAMKDSLISLNSFILNVLLSFNNGVAYLTAWRLGSNANEKHFSACAGFGNIEAGKRDCTFLEMLRLSSNTLTKAQWVGNEEEGGLHDFKRTGKHDPEQEMMLPDELQYLRTKYDGSDESFLPHKDKFPSGLNETKIQRLLNDGILRALREFQKMTKLPPKAENCFQSLLKCEEESLSGEAYNEALNLDMFQYSEINYSKMQEENHEFLQTLISNLKPNLLMESRSSPPISSSSPLNDESIAAFGLIPRIRDEVLEVITSTPTPASDEQTQDEQDVAIFKLLEVQQELEDNAAANIEASISSSSIYDLKEKKKHLWMLSDGENQPRDVRTVCSLLNSDPDGTRLLDRNRLQRVTKMKEENKPFSNHLTISNSFIAAGTFIAVSFLDKTSGTYIYWIGEILRMVNRIKTSAGKKGSSTLWHNPVTLAAAQTTYKNTLHVSCSWMVPYELDENGTEITSCPFATNYKYTLDFKENINEVQARHIISTPLMIKDPSTNSYRIEEGDLNIIKEYINQLNSSAKALDDEAAALEENIEEETCNAFEAGDFVLVRSTNGSSKFVVGQVVSKNIESKIFMINVWKKEAITKGESKSIISDIGLVKFSKDVKGAKHASEEFDCSAAARKLNRVMDGIPKITSRTTSKYFRIAEVNSTAIY